MITSRSELRTSRQTTDKWPEKVSPQFVAFVDWPASAWVILGQRCSAATSLATSSTGTVLLPRQMSQIVGHALVKEGPVQFQHGFWRCCTVFFSSDPDPAVSSSTLQFLLVATERISPISEVLWSASLITVMNNDVPLLKSWPFSFYCRPRLQTIGALPQRPALAVQEVPRQLHLHHNTW